MINKDLRKDWIDMQQNIIFQAKHVSKSFLTEKSEPMTVLSEVNLTINEGEIIAFLGKSGAGKSTFLRIMAGLLPVSSGEVFCDGELVNGPSHDMSMVFQTFALMPWLTVYQNVSFGLEAKGLPKAEIHEITDDMIELIGLDGYENAYPKQLSGGMRQRVGFARALAVEPKILLLDEPFSALDIFTGQKLRHDLIEMWEEKKISTKSIVLVTHNVEEAVMVADRIVFFDSNPGRIGQEFKITMPRSQRTKLNTLDQVEEISRLLTEQIAHAEAMAHAYDEDDN